MREHRSPDAREIAAARVPYLDAVTEEVLRVAVTAPGTSRRTLVDAQVLGATVPRGIDVFVWSSGPDFLRPAVRPPVPEDRRSASCRAAKGRVGAWREEDMGRFVPERWLVTGEDGEVVFNANAGPMLAFGLGPRGCYGRRLAYLQLRMLIVLLVWNFEISDPREELASFQAVDKFVHTPMYCYVRLTPIATA